MPTNNLLQYSDNYSKTCGSLWQYYKVEPNDNLAGSKSFRFKVKKKEVLLLVVIQKMLK